MKILFMGTPDIAASCLMALIDAGGSYEMPVNFDIPEDIQKVATVECHIEERIAK